MDFETLIGPTKYSFSFINSTTVLVSGVNAEYILYKKKFWHCADEIPDSLIKALAAAIDERTGANTMA